MPIPQSSAIHYAPQQMPTLVDHLDALARAFAHALDPVIVVDAAGNISYANQAARPYCDRDSPLMTALWPILRGEAPERVEWGETGPGGFRAWFACTVSPLRHDAGRVFVCVSSDITALKRSEARLRRSEQLLVDAQGVAHLGTWEWDVSEPQAYWSAELYRIYGLSPEVYTPSYEAYLAMVHPDDRQRVMEATTRVFQEHVPYSHDERIFRPDGSMRHLHTWAYPILDDEGRLRRLVGVCQDITERQEAEEHVRRLNTELEQRVAERTRQLETSMRDLEAFNSMVSHDLRSPLSTIALAESVMDGVADQPPEIARARERIRRAVAQMTELIDDLLAFARIESTPLERSPVDLSGMAHEIVTELKQSDPERKVEVHIEPHLRCVADRGLMRIALQNLIGNAWKYTSRVAAARIALSEASIDGSRVLLVRDNGAGFDMKDAHRLFAPFQRLHSERDFKGTGFGLASVQRIMERHGARVWAEGAPGAGATFFVALPEGDVMGPMAR